MSAEALKDILPIPDSTEIVSDPDKRESAGTLHERPTASHDLAVEAKHGGEDIGTGAAQARASDFSSKAESIDQAKVDHDEDIVNLGWNEPEQHIQNPLVGRLDNEELWLLIRRFNKVSILVEPKNYWAMC